MNKCILMILILLGSLPVYGAGLNDAIKSAVENNPALIAAQKEAGAAAAVSHKGWFLQNPRAGMEYSNINSDGLMTGEPMKKAYITGTLPNPVSFLFELNSGNDMADYYNETAEAKKTAAAREAVIAYFELYAAEKSYAAVYELGAFMKKAAKISADRYASGQASEQAALRAEVEASRLQGELLELDSDKKAARSALNYVTGESAFTASDAAFEDPKIPKFAIDHDKIKKEIIKNSPELKAAEYMKGAFENKKNRAFSAYIPDLEIKYSRYFEPVSNAYDLMFEVEIPFFFLTNQFADSGAALNSAEAKEKESEEVLNMITYNGSKYYEKADADYRVLRLYDTSLIPQAKAALNSVMNLYKTGKTEFINLADALRELLELQKDYYTHLTEYMKNYTALYALAGKIYMEETK